MWQVSEFAEEWREEGGYNKLPVGAFWGGGRGVMGSDHYDHRAACFAHFVFHRTEVR